MELTKLDKENLKWIEEYLENVTYHEIPQSFLNQLDKWFESVSYIKSLVEIKKQNITD